MAGVVDQQVYRLLAQHLSHPLGPVVGREVGRHDPHLTAVRGPQLLGDAVQAVLVTRDEDEVVTPRSQRSRERQPDPRCGTGHE